MAEKVEDFLAHYGVAGMKWGQRRAHSANLKSLDKTEKRKDADKQSKDVTKARAKLKSGEVKATLKAAKTQYKADREIVGKVAAKKTLNKVKDKAMKDVEKANEYKNGKEKAVAVTAIAGLVLVSALMNASRN